MGLRYEICKKSQFKNNYFKDFSGFSKQMPQMFKAFQGTKSATGERF